MSISTNTPPRTTNTDRSRLGVRETKPFYRISEFMIYVLAAALILIFGYSGSDEMNTYRTWQLFSVVFAAYIVSRGLSKAGSREGARDDRQRPLTLSRFCCEAP